MKKGNKRNNKNYFSNFLIFVVAFAVAVAIILPFRTILATYNIPLWNTDGSSTIYKQAGEVVIGDTIASGTLLLDVAGQVGATEYCDENGNNCTAAGSIGGFTGTTGSVPFAGAGGSLTEDNANLFWDDTNDRLGVGTNTPAFLLDVNDTVKANNSGQIGFLDGDPGGGLGAPLAAIFLAHDTDETDFNNPFGSAYYADTERWYSTVNAGTLPTTGIDLQYTGSWRTPWVTGAHDYTTIMGDESEPIYGGTGTVNRLNGYYGYARVSGTGTGNTVIGVGGTSGSDGGATVGHAIGVSGNVTSWGVAPTITDASAFWGGIQSNANITNAYGLHLRNWSTSGTVTNSYGIYMDSSIDVGINSYALYSSSNSDSYLAGNLGIGTNTPSQQLELTNSIELVETTASDEGVIYKGAVPFMHNFNPPDNGTVDPLGYNTFVGLDAGNFTMGSTATVNWDSTYNTGIGYSALNSNTIGQGNSALGYLALTSNATGDLNTAIGPWSLTANIDGSNNTALGYSSLIDNTSGIRNTAAGGWSLHQNITGDQNTAHGTGALYYNTTGNNNTAVGTFSGGGIADYTNSNDNTFFGNYSGYNVGSNMDYNIFLGGQAGESQTAGSRNLVIGANIDTQNATGSNQMSIGNLIFGTGLDGINTTISSGAIGIGDNSPDTGTSTLKLDVEGSVGATEYCDENGNNCVAAGSFGGFTGTTGSVPFAGVAGSLTEDNANLFWDDANDRLGIGTTIPNSSLDVEDTLKVDNGHIYLLDADATNFWASEKITLVDSLDETDYAGGWSVTEMKDITVNAGTMGVTDSKVFNAEYNYIHTDPSSAHDYANLLAYQNNIGHAGTGTVASQNGLYQYSMLWGPGTITNEAAVTGLAGMSAAAATGTVANAIALRGSIQVQSSASGTIQNASAVYASVGVQSTTSATINNLAGLNITNWGIGGSSTVDTSYGIYMDSSIDVGTTSYALYSASNSDSYLAGDLGIGTNAPSQQLELTKSIELVETTASDEGVIYKGGVSFMHNFNPPDNGTVDPLGYNTFVGLNAGNFTMGSTATLNTESSSNNAFGISAMASNTTGYENSAVGGLSLYSNTNGFRNTASGQEALYSNLGGYANSAHGRSALYSNTTGYYNTAQGMNALYSNTTGYLNSAHGHGSLHYSQNGVGNTTQGAYSGRGTALYTGSDNNTVLGYFAGYNMSSNMDNNILVGSRAGYNHTSGSNNIVIGYNMDAATLTGSNQMSIGNLIYGTGINGTGTTISSGDIGIGRVPTTNRLEVAGDASKNVAGSWLANSDERLKTNIEQLNSRQMLDQILSLRGVSYEWNDDKTDMERPTGIQYGMIAQEIDDVFPSLVSEDAGGYLQTAYGTYDAMLIEAIRGLREEKDEQITALKDEKDREIKELREENAVQAQQITDLNEQNNEIIKRLEILEQK